MNKLAKLATLGTMVLILVGCSGAPKPSNVSEVGSSPTTNSATTDGTASPESSSAVPASDFAKCSEKSMAGPTSKVVIYDCPVEDAPEGITTIRFIEKDASSAGVMVLQDNNVPVNSVPPEMAQWIVQYGSQRYAKLALLASPETPTEEWTKQGWTVEAKTSTAVALSYSKP